MLKVLSDTSIRPTLATITPLEAVNRAYGILLFRWAVQICLCIDYRLIQTLRACVPHTPYTLVLKFVPLQVGCVAQPRTRLAGMQATACYASVLKFVPSAGSVCGAATHAVGGDAGYG